MADERRVVTQTDRNRSLRDRLSRGTAGRTIDLSITELEIAVKDLQDLARARLG